MCCYTKMAALRNVVINSFFILSPSHHVLLPYDIPGLVFHPGCLSCLIPSAPSILRIKG